MIFSVLGFLILLWRFGPSLAARLKPQREFKTSGEDATDYVSIIVPARNEEANIARILTSLLAIEHEKLEIIVVNDGSTDRTREIADSFIGRTAAAASTMPASTVSASGEVKPTHVIRVIDASARPVGWTGKNWACEQGALIARGQWLLFTDADTTHEPQSLQRALWKMKAEQLDMMSALPYHESEALVEKLLGPFHMMVYISSSGFSKPRPRALFSIGQYLLFRKESYMRIGTHDCVKQSFCEDLELAERVFSEGLRYGLDPSGQIFRVRMYDSFATFVAGWRRIFRIGFSHARLARAIEIFLVIACLTASFHFASASGVEVCLAIAGLVLLASVQGRYGRFSVLGVVLAPFGIGVFVTVTLLALFDRISGADLRWRGRSYKVNA